MIPLWAPRASRDYTRGNEMEEAARFPPCNSEKLRREEGSSAPPRAPPSLPTLVSEEYRRLCCAAPALWFILQHLGELRVGQGNGAQSVPAGSMAPSARSPPSREQSPGPTGAASRGVVGPPPVTRAASQPMIRRAWKGGVKRRRRKIMKAAPVAPAVRASRLLVHPAGVKRR